MSPDDHFMREALREARMAFEDDEVPVGAVVVCGSRIIARGRNLTETLNDVTAHAEMQAITSAASFLGGKFLRECTLYVTLEPCPMCAGAMYWAQLGRLVYAASDPKKGYSTISASLLHPSTSVECGLMSEESSHLLQEFFRAKR